MKPSNKNNDKKKCVLAYSGGLDTAAIVVWLRESGYEVHAVLVDVGQDEDLDALCVKAIRLGATSAVVRDAKPAMYDTVVPMTIGLGATYEGTYRLGTALARPFIAAEQVRLARQLGGATLVHGATGKGNDQIRFEYAYRSLGPECPVLAPWKVWDFEGRSDLIAYLESKGFHDKYDVVKEYSLDENLWHLSVEGGVLERAEACVDVAKVLEAVADKFAVSGCEATTCDQDSDSVEIEFREGVPVAVDGRLLPLPQVVGGLNHRFRSAPWAWDLIIENRMTGIKSRGLYINPAAKVLAVAVDALARSCLNKVAYDQYVELGYKYGAMLYGGEYFSLQRVMLEATGKAVLASLTGAVTVDVSHSPYASQIVAEDAIFKQEAATFEASSFSHADAAGFIELGWLSAVGKPFEGGCDEDVVETEKRAASFVRKVQPVSGARLVPSAV
jgi:argininosuccinate synthase